jgi:hypothetical protein
MPKGVKLSKETIAKRTASVLGSKRSAETRKRMSDAATGKPKSEAHKESLRRSRTGVPIHTVESKARISEALRKRVRHPHSKEAIEKMSWSHSGMNNPNFGKERSYETRLKIRENNIGGFWYGNVRYPEKAKYCDMFNNGFRERVRAFFGYVCVRCGKPQRNISLDVHHVINNKTSCCDDAPRLFVPLHKDCHSSVGKDDPDWIEYFTWIILEFYGGKCYMTRKEMASYTISLRSIDAISKKLSSEFLSCLPKWFNDRMCPEVF